MQTNVTVSRTDFASAYFLLSKWIAVHDCAELARHGASKGCSGRTPYPNWLRLPSLVFPFWRWRVGKWTSTFGGLHTSLRCKLCMLCCIGAFLTRKGHFGGFRRVFTDVRFQDLSIDKRLLRGIEVGDEAFLYFKFPPYTYIIHSTYIVHIYISYHIAALCVQAAVGAGARLTPVQHQAFSQLQRAGEAGLQWAWCFSMFFGDLWFDLWWIWWLM